MRLGIAHHLGWAVAVTASADHAVVDRRRIELIEPGLPTAPIHHEGGAFPLHRPADPLDDDALSALVADVRASARRATSAALDALDALANAVPGAITSMSLRAWPADFPDDIAVQRRVPYESRADSVMYRQVLAELAEQRGWTVQFYDAKDVEVEAVRILGQQATGYSSARGRAWGPRGRRTIGCRSPQRSWPPEQAPELRHPHRPGECPPRLPIESAEPVNGAGSWA